MDESKKEEICHIGHCVGKQGSQSPAGNQAGVEKLAIETRTDSKAKTPSGGEGK